MLPSLHSFEKPITPSTGKIPRRCQMILAIGLLLLASFIPDALQAGTNIWSRAGGPHGGRILDLKIHPSNSLVIYAGTESGGFFLSQDGGSSWESRSEGLDLLTVNELLPVAISSSTLYAATTSGVYRSSNLGSSWTVRSGGLTSTLAQCMAMDPATINHLLCGTANGLFETIDGGINWTASSSGLTSTSVFDLYWDTSENRIFAGTGAGVFTASMPLGSWTDSSSGLSGLSLFIKDIAAAPDDADHLFLATYGGIYESVDAGLNWIPRNTGLSDTRAQALWVDPLDALHLVAGTEGGVFESFDGAASWSVLNDGLDDLVIRCLAHDGSALLAGSFHRGIHRLQDGTWIQANDGLNNVFLQEIGFDGNGYQPIVAAFGGLYRSWDMATSYEFLDEGIDVADVRTVCYLPSDSDVIFAGSNYGGIYRSTSGGSSFSLVGLTGMTVRVVRPHPTDPDIIYAGSYDGVYKSFNGGDSWTRKSNGMLADNVNDLVIDPSNPEILYTGNYLGYIYRSTDAAENWTQLTSGLGANIVFGLDVHPTSSSILLAGGFESKGIWRSTDSGDSWLDVSTGLSNKSIWDVCFDPVDPDVAYAATQGGVAISTDGGLNWSDLSEGLIIPDIRDVAVDPSDHRRIFAASYGGGLYSFTREPALAGPPASIARAVLHPSYPNPFNPSTTLAFELEEGRLHDVLLEIYDLRGRSVKTLLRGNVEGGLTTVIWNGDDRDGMPLASGIYLAHLSVDGNPAGSRKMTLLK